MKRILCILLALPGMAHAGWVTYSSPYSIPYFSLDHCQQLPKDQYGADRCYTKIDQQCQWVKATTGDYRANKRFFENCSPLAPSTMGPLLIRYFRSGDLPKDAPKEISCLLEPQAQLTDNFYYHENSKYRIEKCGNIQCGPNQYCVLHEMSASDGEKSFISQCLNVPPPTDANSFGAKHEDRDYALCQLEN